LIIGMRMWDDYLPGAAFIYNYNGTTWEQTIELVPDEAINGDHVGESVYISNNYVIVGAHASDDGEGAAYIYKSIDGTWTEIIRLKADDSSGAEDYFGADAAISDDYAMVGAYKNDNGKGAVYVFENNNDTWEQTQKIVAPDAGNNDGFGCDIDFNDEVLVIGARSDGLAGTAYVYKNIDGTWTFFEKIIPSDGEEDDDFGDAVAISGDNFIIGAQWCDIFGVNSGAAYVYSTLSPENNVIQFDVPGQIGDEIIDETEHTISLEVDYGTNVTDLSPMIEISESATIDPISGVSQDFTNPVEYTVTAQNGDAQIWVVTVGVATSANTVSVDDFKIYPNPTTGKFKINSNTKISNIIVRDFTGKPILETDKTEITLKYKGIFFIELDIENTRIVKKIIVK